MIYPVTQNAEIFKNIGVRNRSTIHLRNAFNAVNIQPFFGEPYPIAYTGADMTVVQLLTTLIASNRFHFANLRFFRLSIAGEENAPPTPIDLDKFIQWSDEPLAWSAKMADVAKFRPSDLADLRLLAWMSAGDYTTVK